jgi:hypothetical protein
MTTTTLTKQQVKQFGPKVYTENGTKYRITATVRYDDDCGNGHNSFSITGEIDRKDGRGRWVEDGGGCIHDEIVQHFPDLAPFIKWHLCSSDGPMHYIANTVYCAGNRDHNGKAAGEPCRWSKGLTFDNVPIMHRVDDLFFDWLREQCETSPRPQFEIVEFQHDRDPGTFTPNYSFKGFDHADKWHRCPFNDKAEAEQMRAAFSQCEPHFVVTATDWATGKARQLDAARNAAIWPDATDEELTSPGLADRLNDRLPGLLAEFRAAVESLGFVY